MVEKTAYCAACNAYLPPDAGACPTCQGPLVVRRLEKPEDVFDAPAPGEAPRRIPRAERQRDEGSIARSFYVTFLCHVLSLLISVPLVGVGGLFLVPLYQWIYLIPLAIYEFVKGRWRGGAGFLLAGLVTFLIGVAICGGMLSSW